MRHKNGEQGGHMHVRVLHVFDRPGATVMFSKSVDDALVAGENLLGRADHGHTHNIITLL